ncbi:CoA transferase [Teredinibacter purpureus]|uniref:CoA transferase n=1 Tax=Teredinibacter purpureus TaxID=2731756 RepID=UPI000A8DD665|nr:CoA transferase [Teredinibacter purpureus]
MQKLTHLLKGCSLDVDVIGASVGSPAGFSSVIQSLSDQSRTLGLQPKLNQVNAPSPSLAFRFSTPFTKPVYCTITAWENAPQRAGGEMVLQAATGIMSVHGRATGNAQALGLPYVSTLTSALALHGAFASAVGQLRGLDCERCDISMMSAGLLAVGQYLAGATANTDTEKLTPDTFTGELHPPFVSSDGIIFELETLTPEPWKNFWCAIGVTPKQAGKGWSAFLMRYAKAVAPLPSELKQAVSRLSYKHIEELCKSTGLSICSVRSIAERQKDSDYAEQRQHGPWHFSTEGASHYNAQNNSHTPNSSHKQRPTNQLPLTGLVVIEACRRIQGPLAGHLLALLGATVIRIEPPGGDPLRGMPPVEGDVSVRFDALNRLKSIREIDLKTATGQAEVKALARDADVFLHNWAPEKAAEFQLDSADMAKINPHLIYAYAGGWGTLDGQQTLPGTDFMVQAFSGIAAIISAHSGQNGGSLFTVLDTLGGVIAAQGITAALLARYLNNETVRVDTSLLGAAHLLRHSSNSIDSRLHINPLTSSVNFLPVNNIYRTLQGSLAIECFDEQSIARFAEAIGVTVPIQTPSFIDAVKEKLLTRAAQHWLKVIVAADVAVAKVVVDLDELTTHPYSKICLALAPNTYAQVKSPWRFNKTPSVMNNSGIKDLVPFALRKQWVDEGVYPNQSIFALFQQHAQQEPDKPAILTLMDTITYGQLQDSTLRLASSFQQLGIVAGDVIAYQLPNSWHCCLIDLAAAALGAVVAPFPLGRGRLDIEALLGRCNARVFIGVEQYAGINICELIESLRPTLLSLRFMIVDSASRTAWYNLQSLLETTPITREHLPDVCPHSPARLLVSSGTESEPKLVAYSHNALLGGRGRFLQRLIQEGGHFRGLYLVPLGSAFGSTATVGALSFLGGSIVLLSKFDPAAAVQVMQEFKPTHILGVPTMFQRIAVEPSLASIDKSSLHCVVSGGAVIDEATIHRCRDAFACNFVNLYGSADGVNCHNHPEDHPETILHTVGRPNPSVCALKIIDEQGIELPQGRTGEIIARGPLSPMQYVNAPELDARYRDSLGWVHTGDIGRMDEYGYLVLSGRKKDIIIRGGVNISPVQIEKLATGHPDIIGAACVPIADHDVGHRMCICLMLRIGAERPSLLAMSEFLVAEGIEVNKLPEYLRFYKDFPLSPAGKIDKISLAADLESLSTSVARAEQVV